MSLTKVSYSMIDSAPVSVIDFGADPTGVSDCSAAVQAAIAFARTRAGNTNSGGVNATTKSAVILFPPGSYKFTATVLVPPNMIFMGDGATILCNESGSTFETGYYNAGVLTSNWALDDATVVAYGLTGLRFENLTFYRGDVALKLRCAIWQSGVFNCQFYETHIAIDSKQCFYSTYDNITIRGDNPGFTAAEGMRFMRASNHVLINNVAISYRDRGMVIGETGVGNASGQINITNCSFEVLLFGIEFVGEFYTVSISDIYLESVDKVFWDQDGALKYNVSIDQCFSNSTTYFVDLSGLRDSYIGPIRDFSALSDVKAVVRLRVDTNANQAIVHLGYFGDPSTGTNRYQLSDGVVTQGYLSSPGGAANNVLTNQYFSKNIVSNQYDNVVPIYETGWYNFAANKVIGAEDEEVKPDPTGTTVFVVTKFLWSEYTAVNYSILITPDAGSGPGGTTPSPIRLKGIAIGSDGTQIVAGGRTVTGGLNVLSGTLQLNWTGFGSSPTDPDYAWMRNGLFTSEGIIKLIA